MGGAAPPSSMPPPNAVQPTGHPPTSTKPTLVSVTRALLKKNWIIKRRHAVATASEILNPLLCILLFVALKTLEPDLDIPGGWAVNSANKTAGSDNTTGSHWPLFAASSLLDDLNATLQSAGLSGVPGSGGNSTPTAAELLNATVPLLTSASSPLSLLTLTSQLRMPRFYFTETTMPGLLLTLALQALSEADRLEQLSQQDLLLCVAKFALLGYTSVDATSLYAVPVECRGKVVPYKLALTPDTLYTRRYVAAVLDAWHPRLPLVPPVLGISPLTTPSFADSRVFFPDEAAMESYLKSPSYGLNVSTPKLYAAVAFYEYPTTSESIGDPRGHDISFAVRMNSTYTDTSFPNAVPRTIGRRFSVNKYIRSVKAQNVLIYATRGFLTLQTAVVRVLNCLPKWDLTTRSVVDPTACQLPRAKSNDEPRLNDRLLRQLDDDLVLGTLLQALGRFGAVAQQALNATGGSGAAAPSLGDVNAVVGQALQALAAADASSVVTNLPDASKQTLLQSLRVAPQSFHGARVFMSPTEAFHYAGFYAKILVVFPIGFVLSYLYGVSRVIVALLMEKETRSRELVKILGVHDAQLVATWLLTYVQLFVVASLLQSAGAAWLLFNHSQWLLLFFFFFSFALSTFGFGFLVSTLFNRARAGSFVGMGLFFMMFFVSFAFQETATEATRTLACLLSPVALAQGINIIAQLESIGVGVRFANAHDRVGNFRFMAAVYMQLLDFVLYMALGVYLDKVMPKEFGVAEKWYFIVSPSYWQRGRQTEANHNDDHTNHEQEVGPNIEPPGSELRQQERDGRAVVISRLRKEFPVPGGTKVAVRSLSLSLYEGQITCLLGHNGAGKTTLLSMLTGMTAPTSGDAIVRGRSIRDDLLGVRRSLGYCPQFSVVYPELTVFEHLQFYAHVKQDAHADVDHIIREVGLTEKRHVQAHALSGGMKRKLSLAIAFLGRSGVVILDEPTSGMDPYSRRSTWELIQRHRAGRVVILTTHFMDEADLLGDRIAIMADGMLRCVGSSLFLKQRFGVGYRLSFVVAVGADKTTLTDQFRLLIANHIPTATLATDIGTELTFQLPFEASAAFPALFDEIDRRQQELRVASYAISVTTLEEIFLKVAETPPNVGLTDSPPTLDANTNKVEAKIDANKKKMDQQMQAVVDMGTDTTTQPVKTHSTLVWFLIQVRALVLKRVLSAKRDRAMLFYSTLLPVVILVAGLSALKLSLFTKDDPRVALTTAGQFTLAQQTPLPMACVDAMGLDAGDDRWCRSVANLLASNSQPTLLPVESRVYDGATSPTVFGIRYDAPPIQPNDTTGYCLRFAQLAFQRGYGKDSESMVPITTTAPVVGQYGGLLLQASQNGSVLSYNVMVNSSALHGAPLFKALADEAVHNFLLTNGTSLDANSPTTYRKVGVYTHPFPLSFKTRSIFGSFLSLPAVMFVLIAFTFIPAAMMPFLVKEKQRESNAKHQQLLSGVSLTAYWTANLIVDLALYLVPMVVAILLLRFYGISTSLSGANANETCTSCTRHVPQAVVALFALFGTAIAPWTYAMSHVMHDAGACLLYTVMLNFLFGLVLLLTSYSLDSLDSTRDANQVLVFLWRCSPLFSLANGLLRVIIADIEALFGLTTATGIARSAFDADVAGYELVYLAVQGPVFFVVALVVDLLQTGELTVCGRDVSLLLASPFKSKSKLSKTNHDDGEAATRQLLLDDEDVRRERERVLAGHQQLASNQSNSDVVRLVQLHKTYTNGKRAVSDLTFGLQRGDCFGFLGINGAGKTTTLKMLTGDLFPSYGTATLNGFDILTQRARVRQSVGYCPQFDALLELLTVQEHLELYGRLKGFRGHQLHQQVQRLLLQFQLSGFANKLAGSLSGGNKRKLSVAIAMLGSPALLFLDEPSTGMDPFSRRFMWDIILEVSVQSGQSTIVLTTHSMEECEALCNRAGIMVGGRLRCLGTIPHLKSRFGDGFLLECKLESATKDELDALVQKIHGVAGSGGKDPDVVSRDELPAACAALGDASRVHWILPDSTNPVDHPTGSTLFEQLQRSSEHTLDAREFCAWWLLEDRVVGLTAFLQSHLGTNSTVGLLERQLDFCRFKIAPTKTSGSPTRSAPTFSVANMFRLIEDSRQRLAIKEYSLSQTSLEQIFNSFARQQDEEKGLAKAYWKPTE